MNKAGSQKDAAGSTTKEFEQKWEAEAISAAQAVATEATTLVTGSVCGGSSRYCNISNSGASTGQKSKSSKGSSRKKKPSSKKFSRKRRSEASITKGRNIVSSSSNVKKYKARPCLTVDSLVTVVHRLDNKRGSTMDAIHGGLIQLGISANMFTLNTMLTRAVRSGQLLEVNENQRFTLPGNPSFCLKSSSSTTSSDRSRAKVESWLSALDPEQQCVHCIFCNRCYCPEQKQRAPGPCCYAELSTPTRRCLNELSTPTHRCLNELSTPTHRCLNELSTPTHRCLNELSTPTHRCLNELSTPTHRCLNELRKPALCCLEELSKPALCCLDELSTPALCCLDELSKPALCCLDELSKPALCCLNELSTSAFRFSDELSTPAPYPSPELTQLGQPQSACIGVEKFLVDTISAGCSTNTEDDDLIVETFSGTSLLSINSEEFQPNPDSVFQPVCDQ